MAHSRTAGPPALIGGFALSALAGVLEALYGPLIPSLRTTFDLDPGAAGLVLAAHFGGSILGMLAWGSIGGRLSTRARLGIGPVAIALGCVGVGTAPVWPLALAAAATIGFGCGLLDAGINTLFAAGFGAQSAALVNLLNAAFGVGAIAAPLAIGLAPQAGFRPAFLATGVLALALLPTLLPGSGSGQLIEVATRSAKKRPPRLVVVGFVALYALVLGVEAAVAGWAPTHLLALGYSESTASLTASLYWAGLIVGRLLAAPISLRVSPHLLVPATLGGAVMALLLGQVPVLAPLAYALAGLMLAPFFAGGLVWLVRVEPGSPGALAFAMVGGSLGSAVLPALVGWFIGVAGAGLTPVAIAGPTLGGVLLAIALRRGAASSAGVRESA